MPTLTTADGDVALLDLGADENKLNGSWMSELDACLDRVTAEPPAALVTHATGKFWSTGLDLDWLGQRPDDAQAFVDGVERTLARMLLLPTTTVAAIQGHAFAAGAMLALAHDFRVMRRDRGFFCLPEVDIGLPFTPGMAALIQAKLTPAAAHEAMTTGRRYGGTDALAVGIVDAAVPEGEVLDCAVERGRTGGGKDAGTLAQIKRHMYAAAAALLSETPLAR